MPWSPQGLLEHIALDPGGSNWLITGSSRGHLTLYDMRFRLPVASWQLPCTGPTGRPVHIDALAPALAPASRLGLAAGEPLPKSPLVYVAAGPHEVSLWDVETGRCHQVPYLPIGLCESTLGAHCIIQLSE